MSRFIEEHKLSCFTVFICGIPGMYFVKSCGNNKLLSEKFDLLTLDDARNWINEYYGK
jgi:hypothetical protein